MHPASCGYAASARRRSALPTQTTGDDNRSRVGLRWLQSTAAPRALPSVAVTARSERIAGVGALPAVGSMEPADTQYAAVDPVVGASAHPSSTGAWPDWICGWRSSRSGAGELSARIGRLLRGVNRCATQPKLQRPNSAVQHRVRWLPLCAIRVRR